MLYHGVLTSCNGFVYSLGAALLDLDEPWRVIARAAATCSPRRSRTNGSATCRTSSSRAPPSSTPSADRLSIYYGAADTVVRLAHGRLSEVQEAVRS